MKVLFETWEVASQICGVNGIHSQTTLVACIFIHIVGVLFNILPLLILIGHKLNKLQMN